MGERLLCFLYKIRQLSPFTTSTYKKTPKTKDSPILWPPLLYLIPNTHVPCEAPAMVKAEEKPSLSGPRQIRSEASETRLSHSFGVRLDHVRITTTGPKLREAVMIHTSDGTPEWILNLGVLVI